MKFKCCENIMHSIVFAQSDVMACCCSKEHKFIKYYKQENNNQFNIDQYEKIRSLYINMFKNNIIPEGCKNCSFIEEKDWDENIGCKNIIISNYTKCSCNCIYCSLLEGNDTLEKKRELNTRKTYNIKSILETLKMYNYVQQNCNIQIAGGEPTEYPNNELNWLINYAVSLSCNLEILSSGINFSKEIEKALRFNNLKLIISPDSGKKYTYERIKRVKSYDKVWSNIKKYVKATKNNKNSKVILKYIIIPGINDSISEIKSFFEKCEYVNCKNVVISIEFGWFEKNINKDLNDDLKNFFIILRKELECYKNNFNINFEPQVRNWLLYNLNKNIN